MKFIKTILILALFSLPSVGLGEGIASMTSVTATNGKALTHHGLAVSCRSQSGKTFVSLTIRPHEKTGLVRCSVTIYDEKGERILVQIDPVANKAPKLKGLPDGSRTHFHVADELVDRIQVRYLLPANEFQSHVYTIKRGELGKLAKLPQ